MHHNLLPSPCVISGSGGSGTRVLARICKDAGLFIGQELNKTEDSLPIGRFLSKWTDAYWQYSFRKTKDDSIIRQMSSDFLLTLSEHGANELSPSIVWGWKAPRSMMILPFLNIFFSDIRFVHLVRDGRDMALSSNQFIYDHHAKTVMGTNRESGSLELLESRLLLWAKVNYWAYKYGTQYMKDKYMTIRFEDLLQFPENGISKLLQFFNLKGNPTELSLNHIKQQSSLGRWRTLESDIQTRLYKVAEPCLKAFNYLP